MTGTEACIALNLVPNLGPVKMRKLLEVFESPERVLLARAAELRRVEKIGDELASSIASWESTVDLPKELALVRDFGAHVVTQSSPEYPRSLREIYNPPIVLYVWGTLTEREPDRPRRSVSSIRPCTSTTGRWEPQAQGAV